MSSKWFLFLPLLVCIVRFSAFAEADGSLSVKTDPDGIEVWLDDKYIGDSPVLDKKLKAGRYSLKLVDPIQHSSTVEEVFIQSGEPTTIEKTIKSRFGSLKVNADPEGSEVSILTTLGKTPLSNDFIVPGKYRLEIHRNGYKPLITDVVVPKGDVVTVSKPLEKIDPLDNKAFARLGLGLVAIGGVVWSIIEANDPEFKHSSNGSRNGCILGGCLAGVCVISLEIVSFF